MKKNQGKSCYLFLLFLVLSQIALSFERAWEKFELQPLAIVYPEDEALNNPPFFHWQAVQGANSYHLSISGRGFREEKDIPWNFYTPVKAFPQGLYTMTIGVKSHDGITSTLLTSKSFRIARPACPFIPDLNRIPMDKAGKFYPSAEVLGIVKKSSEEQASYMDRICAFAARPLQDNLKSLKEPPLYKDGKWDLELWQRKNSACYTVKSYILYQILAYHITNDPAFFENARSMILKVVKWDPVGATGVWESDHAAQTLLYTLSISYSLLKDQLSLEDRAQIRECLRRRSEDMYRALNPFVPKDYSQGPMNDPDNNHPWFCTQGLGFGALALLDEVPEAPQWLAFASQMFYGVYLPRGGSLGDWHEGIDYWSYTLFFVFQFCDALKSSTGIDLYNHPWLQKTAFFKIYTHPPEGSYVPFGDSKGRAPNDFDKLVMMRLASIYNDPLAWRYVDSIKLEFKDGYLLDALLWCGENPGQGQIKTPPMPFACHFEDSGWVVSNNNVFDPAKRILFAFRSGKIYGKGAHYHADQNHFIICAGTDHLLWDAGLYDSYMSPHHKTFTQQTIAHNTILVDGEGQNILTRGAEGILSQCVRREGILTVQGDASNPLIYKGRVKKFLRTINYTNEKDFYIHDMIVLSQPGIVSWLLHSSFPITYDSQKGTLNIRGGQYQLKGKFQPYIPVDAILSEGFPAPPSTPFPNQFHLELKTKTKVEQWNPSLTLTLSPVGE